MNALSRRTALTAIATAAALSPAVAETIASTEEVRPAENPEITAARKRFDELVELLRDRHICDGWRMDERAAAKARAFFDGNTEYFSDDFLDFLYDHGQSIDWIMYGDPSSLICHNAGTSRRATLGRDPELVKKYQAFRELWAKECEAGELPCSDLKTAPKEERDNHARWERLIRKCDAKADALFATRANTLDGMLLKLRVYGWVVGNNEEDLLELDHWNRADAIPESHDMFVATLRDDLARLRDQETGGRKLGNDPFSSSEEDVA